MITSGYEPRTTYFLSPLHTLKTTFSTSHYFCSNAAFHVYLVSVIRYALFVLIPLSLTLTGYLYLCPVFHFCAFPSPEHDASTSYLNTLRQHTFPTHDPQKIAPFRLLALGDPQLESDTFLS
jgi:hypothetical protein